MKKQQNPRFVAHLRRAKCYLLRNPGAICVVVFQALIIASAFLLIEGSFAVDNVATVAYCFLIVGVVLQTATSILEKAPGEVV